MKLYPFSPKRIYRLSGTVNIPSYDRTQGPACAIAAGAARDSNYGNGVERPSCPSFLGPITDSVQISFVPQQSLNFFPEPQEQRSLRPIFGFSQLGVWFD
jgi:hypothetical protein